MYMISVLNGRALVILVIKEVKRQLFSVCWSNTLVQTEISEQLLEMIAVKLYTEGS